MPGESSQELGRNYVYVFSGCLERAVRGFRRNFDVYAHPSKLTFTSISGKPYSFDIAGIYDGSEVFIEAKGHSLGTSLLEEYRIFLAKAYCTVVLHTRHRADQFWFVTNVPFGSSVGCRLWSVDFLLTSLRTAKQTGDLEDFLGQAPLDEERLRAMTSQITVAILTDSFIKAVGVSYKMLPGDTLWGVIKLLHGRIPNGRFQPIVAKVQSMNQLSDPNRIKSGKVLHLPWFGMGEPPEAMV